MVMNVRTITATHGATIPTGQFANRRVEISMTAVVTDEEDWTNDLSDLRLLLRKLIVAEIKMIKANPDG
jgi:hypothetical protein